MRPVPVVIYVAPAGFQVASNFNDFVVPLMEHSRLGGAVSDVATSHVQLIKVLTTFQNVDLHYYFIKFGPLTRPAEATGVSAAKLVECMFLHDSLWHACKYFL